MLGVVVLAATLVAAVNADAANSQLVTFNESLTRRLPPPAPPPPAGILNTASRRPSRLSPAKGRLENAKERHRHFKHHEVYPKHSIRPNKANEIIGPIGVLRQSAGCPVQIKLASSTLNTNLLRNEYFMQSIDHVVNERIPERVIHAKGSGAFGYFEVTNNASDITSAKFLSTNGKKTRLVVRFSSAALKKGSSDLSPGVRGFSVKFYTEDGNFDIPGLNIPVMVSREPLVLIAFSHATNANPVTNMADRNMLWDFIIQNPDTLYAMIILALSPRGLPLGYRYMPGYGLHTMQLVNSANETYFSRFYFTPDLGIQNMTAGSSTDTDYYARDLYDAIANGTYPSWTVNMQPLTLDQVKNASASGVDVFDISKALSTNDYPLREVGKIVLNENPQNYFADVEQLAFNPGNLVPGILGAPDKEFEARALTYRKAQIHRLGINFNKIIVNQPSGVENVYTYNRDGVAPTLDNEGGAPSYYPNSFNGPAPVENWPEIMQIHEERTTNFDQASDFYESLTDTEKTTLATYIASTFSSVTSDVILEKAIALLTQVNEDLSERIQTVIAASS